MLAYDQCNFLLIVNSALLLSLLYNSLLFVTAHSNQLLVVCSSIDSELLALFFDFFHIHLNLNQLK